MLGCLLDVFWWRLHGTLTHSEVQHTLDVRLAGLSCSPLLPHDYVLRRCAGHVLHHGLGGCWTLAAVTGTSVAAAVVAHVYLQPAFSAVPAWLPSNRSSGGLQGALSLAPPPKGCTVMQAGGMLPAPLTSCIPFAVCQVRLWEP